MSMETINSVNQNKGSTKEIVQAYSKNLDAKSLILLEQEEQVKDCAEWLKEIKGQKQVIALSPFAIYELDRQNISYQLPEDYYDPRELYRLGRDNYQRAEKLCAIIDNSIHTACPVTAKLGIKPALFSFYHLKILYDAATIRLFQLFKLVNAESPDVILIYGSGSYPFGVSEKAPFLFFDNRESIYARLLALAGWKALVEILPSLQQPEYAHPPKKDQGAVLNTLKRRVARWLQLHPELYDLVVTVRNMEWRQFFGRLKGYLPPSNNMPVLLIGGYSWDESREELQSAGIGPFFRMQDDLAYWLREPFPNEVDFEGLLNVWEELRGDGEFRKFFVWNDIDFLPVVEERLRFLVQRLTPACLRAYEKTMALLKEEGIRAFLSSHLSNCISCGAAQAAHNGGIPVVIWQHGYRDISLQPMAAYQDIMNADVSFIFGEGVAENSEELAQRFGTKLVPVGSASLDSLKQKVHINKVGKYIKLDRTRKVVLYVTTNFYQNNLYISSPPPFSDNLFWQTQQTIINVLGKHSEYNVIVKTHPNPIYRETPLRSYAKDTGFVNYQFIRNECPFRDLLSIADVIVVDFPSTTLLESLVTEKPIFAYWGHFHIDNKAQKLLERRAYCFNELNDFIYNLDAFLSDGVIDIRVNPNDKAFLEKYGIYNSDGKSGERAAQAIKRILGRDRGQY